MPYFILLISAVFMPTCLSAITWVNEFPIHINGDVSFLETVYEFINAFVSNGAVEGIIAMGVSLSVFFSGLKLKDGDFSGFAKGIIAPLALYALFLTPSSRVHLIDLRADNGVVDYTVGSEYATVTDVPYAIAFVPAASMAIINMTIEIIDNSWTSVHFANKFSAVGFQEFNMAIREAVGRKDGWVSENTPAVLKADYDIQTYIKKCIVGVAEKDSMNSRYSAAPDKAFPEGLNPASYPNTFALNQISYIEYQTGLEQNETCEDAYTILVANNSTIAETAAENTLKKMYPNMDLTTPGANAGFREMIGDTTSVVGTVKKAMVTTATARHYQNQKRLNGVGVDGYSVATDLTIETTLANLRSEGPAKMEWITKILPDAINIIIGIFIACFPILIVVQTFMGANAYGAIGMYFMGFFAFSFNLVGLALVQNIISFYTAQEAQQAITMSMNMPFSATYLPEFMLKQADMAGLAGIIGTISIFAVTPLVFKGESAGFSGAINAVTGAFRGNVGATAQDTLKSSAIDLEIDNQNARKTGAMTESEASSWLARKGYEKGANASSLETMSQIQSGYSMIGAGKAAGDLMSSGKIDNFIKGSHLNAHQTNMKTAGAGAAIDSISDAGDVAFQDGQVGSESINKTSELRNELGYDTKAIGTGGSMNQFAQDKGMEYTGNRPGSIGELIASSISKSASAIESGRGLIESGAFDENGNLLHNGEGNKLLKGMENKSRIDSNKTMGMGKTDLSSDQMNKIQNLSHAGMHSEIGKGAGARDNIRKYGISQYEDNAEYGEKSSTGSTKAKIDMQNGVDGAAKVDITEASIKAGSQIDSLNKSLKVAGAEGGLDSSIKELSKAIDKMSTTQGTLAGGKTASDISTIKGAKGDEKYIQAQANKGLTTGATDWVQNVALGEGNNPKGQVASMMNRVLNSDKDKVLEGMKKIGMVEKDADLSNYMEKVTSGEKFIQAKAIASAAAMGKHDRMSIGGYNFNTSTDVNSGVTRTDASNAETTTSGGSVAFNGGVGIKNPLQHTGKVTTGVDTTDAFLKDGGVKQNGLDNDGNAQFSYNGTDIGAGVVAGHAVEAVKVGAAGYAINKASSMIPGMNGETAFSKVYNNVRGATNGLEDPLDDTSSANSTDERRRTVGKKSSSSVKGGVLGLSVAAAGSLVGDVAHGNNLGTSGAKLFNDISQQVEEDGIAGMARNVIYGGAGNRNLVQKNNNSLPKTLAVGGTAMFESVAEAGLNFANTASNYAMAGYNSYRSGGSYQGALLQQERNNPGYDLSMAKNVDSFMSPSLPGSNSASTYKNDAGASMVESSSEQVKYLADMSMEQEAFQDSFQDFVKKTMNGEGE